MASVLLVFIVLSLPLARSEWTPECFFIGSSVQQILLPCGEHDVKVINSENECREEVNG